MILVSVFLQDLLDLSGLSDQPGLSDLTVIEHLTNKILEPLLCFLDGYIVQLCAGHVQVTAASHAFHDDLDVHLVDRSCADVDDIIVGCQDKRGFDALDVQQLIGNLGTDDGRTLQPLTGTYRQDKGTSRRCAGLLPLPDSPGHPHGTSFVPG